jgi:hypothetical protein
MPDADSAVDVDLKADVRVRLGVPESFLRFIKHTVSTKLGD